MSLPELIALFPWFCTCLFLSSYKKQYPPFLLSLLYPWLLSQRPSTFYSSLVLHNWEYSESRRPEQRVVKLEELPQQEQKCKCTIFCQVWLSTYFVSLAANFGCRKDWYRLTGSWHSTGSYGLCCGLRWEENGLWVAHHEAAGGAGRSQVARAAADSAGGKFMHFAQSGINKVILVFRHC